MAKAMREYQLQRVVRERDEARQSRQRLQHELEPLRDMLAAIRDDFFNYGEGYDAEMDEMIGSPYAVLQNIDSLLHAFTPEQMKEAKKLLIEALRR